MRLLNPMHLSLVKLISSVAICSGILIQVGCDGAGGVDGSGGGNVLGRVLGNKDHFLPIKAISYRRRKESTSGIAIVPIFKDGELQFIAGGTKTDHAYNISYGAFTPSGEIAWDLTAKYGDQNPRPSEKAEVNDRPLFIKAAVNAGDINGDGFDDLCATVGTLRSHVAIISGIDGKVIVQAEVKSQIGTRLGIKAYPDDIVDLDGDGTKDFRFIYKQPSDYFCMALSGKDLTAIEETTFQIPDDHKKSKLVRCLADETGDGIKEILVAVGASNLDGIKKDRKFVVVDGKTFKLVRTIKKSIFDKYVFAIGVHSLGDVNGDGIVDLLKYETQGAQSNRRNGFVCAVDGASGELIWQIDGGELGGPDLESRSTPTMTKDTIVYHKVDNDLGNFCAMVPDQNGDAIYDSVVAVRIDADAPLRRTLLLISGSDGSILKRHVLTEKKMSPIVISLVDPDSKDQKLKVGVLGAATGPKGLAVIEF